MLGYLVLVALQVAAAVFGAPALKAKIPVSGDFDIFVLAVVIAVVVWLVGVVGSLILKDVGMPTSATLAAALVVALIVAAVLKFFPGVTSAIPFKAPDQMWIVAGAVLGYLLRR